MMSVSPVNEPTGVKLMSTTKAFTNRFLARSNDGTDHEVSVYRITNAYSRQGGTARVTGKQFENNDGSRLSFVSPGVLSLGALVLRSDDPMAQSETF